MATDNGAEDAQAVMSEPALVTPDDAPTRGKPGRKPKQRPEPAIPALPETDEEQPAMALGQPDVMDEQAPAPGDERAAEMADPVGADEGGSITSSNRMTAGTPVNSLLLGTGLALAASLTGCGPAGCWPGKEGGCPAYSGAVLVGGAAIAALGGEPGGHTEDAPSWRRTLPGPAQRGVFVVSGEERAQGWSIRRATLAAPAQAAGRACAPGPVQYGTSNELLGCILAADAVIAGVRVPAGQGFLCRADERGCVVYAAAEPGLQVGALGLSRGWGVTVADGKVRDRLGTDPARVLDLTPQERAGLEAHGVVVGGWRLLHPSVTPAGINDAVAPDGSGQAAGRAGQYMTVPFEASAGRRP